jgi:hypothetical protein
MTTKIQELELKLENLKLEEKKNLSIYREFQDKKSQAFTKFIKNYFEDIMEEGDEISTSTETFSYTRPKGENNSNSEIFSIRFEKDWSTDNITNIALSAYSTNDNSDFQLLRLVTIGKAANIILKQKTNILYGYNVLKESFKAETKDINKTESSIYYEISNIDKEIESIKFNANWDLLTSEEGLVFNSPNIKDLPVLDLIGGGYIDKIKSLKILSYSTSKRTVELEAEYMGYSWETDENGSYQQTGKFIKTTLGKVKVTELERLVRVHSNKNS